MTTPVVTPNEAALIIDTVPGLSPAERKKLFERWEKGEPDIVAEMTRRRRLRWFFAYQKMKGAL